MQEWHFRPLTIEWNPIAVVLLRASFNIEYAIVPHHAVVFSPHFGSLGVSTSGNGFSESDTYTTIGAELGYHYWTGERGASGFFIGPSLVFDHTSESLTCSDPSCTGGAGVSFTSYGIAVDLGGQHIFDNGFTLGGGFGLQYLAASTTVNASGLAHFSGVLPRFLLSVGYSF